MRGMAQRAGGMMAALVCAAVGADYEVRVDLRNVSGEAKTNWPVVLRVYTVLGRCLPPGSVNPEGFHVYDPSGQEVPHALEKLPPDSQPGNDELVFVIPTIEAGQTLSYRITNTAAKSAKRAEIDVVNSPHNLIADGGFEAAGLGEFSAPGRKDGKAARSGKAALLVAADNAAVSTRYAKPLALHKGSWYYLGVWSKTENVARFGYQARGGAYVQLTAPDPKDAKKRVPALRGQVTPQCSTRDWLKLAAEGEATRWGMDRYVAQAEHAEATLELELRQRKHYYMEEGRTAGSWWLDDLVLMEQPEVEVRFDLAVEPLMKEGVFLFTRPPHTYLGNLKDQERPGGQEWCSYPYPHERLTALDKFALKGQRVSFCVGIYHTRPIPGVVVRVAGGALAAGEAKLPVELVEFLPGFAGEGTGRYMKPLGEGGAAEPVSLAGDLGVRYFFLTFLVPPDAKAGKYTGQAEILFEKDKLRQAVPVTLRVQDMVQPVPQGPYVGIILQGGDPPFNDESLKVYVRSGFTSLTRFGGFLSYEKDAAGAWQVDLAKLNERMMWLKGFGLPSVCVFSDFDTGPRWNGGELLKRTRPKDFNEGKRLWGERLKTAEAAWKAQIKRIEEARKQHPEWPTLIYMTFDEPNLGGGVNGIPEPAMGWVNEVAPDALTTLDCQFDPFPVCIKWYTVPAFDDPADWAGPEVYSWVRRQGKRFGFCGSAREEGDSARYQAGMLMVATGATYFHAWHLSRPEKMAQNMAFDKESKRVLRAVSMLNWAAGMNDLKAHSLLRAAMADAAKSSDAAKRSALKAAEDYLAGVFAIFNGDHKPTWPNEPYLGTTTDWGSEGFYDQWQEQMARHAAALLGVKWVE
ncbi:MAG: hypothetical protein FJ291_15970 [Planctomycetes bacterium]|nr:hypothetical protein [Planctomycetota bacterium]